MTRYIEVPTLANPKNLFQFVAPKPCAEIHAADHDPVLS